MKSISRTVWILSLVSLLTDMASEMLYPVVPFYLKEIGFSVFLIGILEGVAEATAGLSKGYFGKMSDASGRRVKFVQIGYSLSAVSKPMMAFFVFPLWVFFSRTIDRLGKGIRTGARDALLADESSPQTKARIFGFHRSMDTLGAVFGPSLALCYLYFHPGNYRTLFFIAFIPGLLAIAACSWLKERSAPPKPRSGNPSFFSFLAYWQESGIPYRKLVAGLLFFALFNSADVFLLLKGKEAGLGDTTLILAYIFYNLVYAIFAFPFGIIADRRGLKTVFVMGLATFSLVYFGMAGCRNPYLYFGLFFLYGLYAAATEGISKAWITTISDKDHRATAIGFFSGFQSICTLLASSMTGLIWFQFGSSWALGLTAVMAAAVAGYFVIMVPRPLTA